MALVDPGLCHTYLYLHQGQASKEFPTTSALRSTKLHRYYTDGLLHAVINGSRTAHAELPNDSPTTDSIYNGAPWLAANHEPANDELANHEPAYDELANHEPTYDSRPLLPT